MADTYLDGFDPISLAIEALRDMPNTEFVQPIGPYECSYELLAFLVEVKRYSKEVVEGVEGGKPEGSWTGYLYFHPAPA